MRNAKCENEKEKFELRDPLSNFPFFVFVFVFAFRISFCYAYAISEGGNMKAVWNGAVLAESDKTEVVERNQYFPPDSINKQYFKPSNTHTTCPWKGEASYYTVEVDGKTNPDAAWFYPDPKEAAANIKDYVAFWKGVVVE